MSEDIYSSIKYTLADIWNEVEREKVEYGRKYLLDIQSVSDTVPAPDGVQAYLQAAEGVPDIKVIIDETGEFSGRPEPPAGNAYVLVSGPDETRVFWDRVATFWSPPEAALNDQIIHTNLPDFPAGY